MRKNTAATVLNVTTQIGPERGPKVNMSINKNHKAGKKSKKTSGNSHKNEATSTESAIMICDDCIIDALYGWVDYNPATGRLRLAKCTNKVWLAIEKLGGIRATAKLLGLPEREIHQWIDEYYIPHGIVEEVARLSLYSIRELQVPIMWVESNGCYWPASGYCAERAANTEQHKTQALQKHSSKDAMVNKAYRAAVVKAQARTLKQEQTNIQWEMLVESYGGSAFDSEGYLRHREYAERLPRCAGDGETDYPRYMEIDGSEPEEDPNARPFEGPERDLLEVDTQLIPEGNPEMEKYGKFL